MTAALAEPPTSFLAAILSDESFRPAEPTILADTGLSDSLIDSLVCKYLQAAGTTSGRNIAEQLGLPLGLVEPELHKLRNRQFATHTGSAPLNDYYYTIT